MSARPTAEKPLHSSSSKIRGILFDKDGTLIDFNKTWIPRVLEVAEYLANDCGQPDRVNELLLAGGFDPQQQSWKPDSPLAAGTNQQVYDLWGQMLGIEIDGDRYAHCQWIFRLSHSDYAPVLDDMDGFMHSLQLHGIVLGVATMDDEANARSTLEQLHIASRFDFVCGADSGFGIKPGPGMVNAFCQHTHLSADSVVMVGDSPFDLVMGRNAGVALTVGVLTGATEARHLESHADYVFDDIGGLLSLVS